MVSMREAIESSDLDAFGEALAPDVVWVGRYPGELCRNRDEVLEMLRRAQAMGVHPTPEIVFEEDDLFVVDPHLDGRHQVIALRDGLVSEVRAFVSREAAMDVVEGRPWSG
jgi:ketosteroid isomerase-like protein